MATILVVDDEKDIADVVQYNLEKEGFKTVWARDGNQALKLAYNTTPDLIVLDLMLPGINGLELCRLLKKDDRTNNVPIIFLTVKNEEIDKVVGLELGADDYITKPFSPREVVARVKAVLRRFNKERIGESKPVMSFGNLVIDSLKHEVKLKNKLIELTATEFKLLEFLASNKEVLFDRDKLLENVWGTESFVEPRTVDVHVKKIRQKLGKDAGQYLKTVRGIGYKFQC